MNLDEKWQKRFIKLAYDVIEWSSDKTRVGCVIIGERKNIISTGFNGFPSGVEENNLRKSPEYKQFYTCHAEQNAIDLAECSLRGAILFSTHEPCAQCARSIIQKGIKTVYYCETMDNERWRDSLMASRAMFKEAGIEVCQISNTKESLFAVVAHSSTGNLSDNISLTSECHLKTTSQLSTETQKVQIRWESDGLNLPEPPKGQKVLRGL